MYYNNKTFVYLNGEIVKASEAKIDLYSQTLHYGYGVFEGIRSYKTVMAKQKFLRRLSILKGLKNSAKH